MFSFLRSLDLKVILSLYVNRCKTMHGALKRIPMKFMKMHKQKSKMKLFCFTMQKKNKKILLKIYVDSVYLVFTLKFKSPRLPS